MARRKTKIKFFTIADYEEEERWLEEEHRNGWRLVKLIPPVFFIFEETKPEDYIYKLDYKNKEMPNDYFQMFKDYGWEYCGYSLGWNYFRKAASQVRAEEEGEIFSDDESKLDMIKYLMLTRLLPLLIIFFAVLVPGIGRLRLTEGFIVILSFIIYVLAGVLYIYVFVRVGLRLWQMRNKINNKS